MKSEDKIRERLESAQEHCMIEEIEVLEWVLEGSDE